MQAEHDYGIDQNGNVSLLKKTEDKTDTLYSVTTDGKGKKTVNKEKGSVTINKDSKGNSILSDLANNSKTETWANGEDSTMEVTTSTAVVDEKDKNEIFKVFNFAADNTNVEWSLGKISYQGLGTNYQLGTFHMDDLSPGLNNWSIGKISGMIHSHPKPRTAKEKDDSLYGDRSVGHQFLNRNGENTPYLIYFPFDKSTTRIGLPKNSSSNGVTIEHNIKNPKF